MEKTEPGVSGRCLVVLLVPETVQDLETAPVDVEVKRFIRDVRVVALVDTTTGKPAWGLLFTRRSHESRLSLLVEQQKRRLS
ncbi:hypothetical protein I4F81_000877 [Pyropia yezoensis]|uniref:Uncharacterized protein n=1 Tax=Pyropia yezoensis TaxID=2788 RepID=A0ACC3BL94_PYRYE|nr:hypothetical protein I4F81_000877 [Neopyropia yezoensis]